MGVPKFFQYLHERYANLVVNVANDQIPDFDCLFLDMNSIIHKFSNIIEEEAFFNIFKYIDFLFKTVKPKEVFFIAVDGVAPRAKMNQQRTRRFKTAKQAKDTHDLVEQSAGILSHEKRFDSNAVTPGTEYMDRLQQALKTYIAEKIRSDNLWHGVQIILSGHDTPGEGEHKIQEYIRYRRSLPNYNVNTRYCIHGNDSDLIMLGLACHEPYLSLLKNEITLSPKSKVKRAEETRFSLLHISLLRDYIDHEFSSLKVTLGQEYDLERVIDDWIVMTFFFGNDFVPHVVNLDIKNGMLWQMYIEIRPRMDGYINENGRLNLRNLMTYIVGITTVIPDNFDDNHPKSEYYCNKLGLTYSTEMAAHQAEEYFTALQWMSYYYFCGVPSWSWFYPQHYAPLLSDLVQLSEKVISDGITFDLGRVFLPFEHLFAVLPPDSSHLLPDCLSELMTMEDSPIVDFYPRTFKTDLDGKKHDRDALVLLPFIDETRLLSALHSPMNALHSPMDAPHSCMHLLSEDDARRNVHAPHTKYEYSQEVLDITTIDPDMFRVARDSLVFGLCPNVQLDDIRQGFPALKHIEHTFTLECASVRVFQNDSTSESIVLKIAPPSVKSTVEVVAQSFLGKMAYVDWPASVLTKVVAVLDKKNRISLHPDTHEVVTTELQPFESAKIEEYIKWQSTEQYKRRAVTLDEGNMIILETFHCEGFVYEMVDPRTTDCRIKLARNWVTTKRHWHLHQLSVLQGDVDDVVTTEARVCSDLGQLFPVDGLVFCMDSRFYGHCGRVVSINNDRGSVVVSRQSLKEPDYRGIMDYDVGQDYMTARKAADELRMDARQFAMITGTIFVSAAMNKQDRLSIGLDLKNNKLNLQIPGWTIKIVGDHGREQWLYSRMVVDVLRDYRAKFPKVFDFIKKTNFESLTIEDLFGANGDTHLIDTSSKVLKSYLKSLQCRSVEKLSKEHKWLYECQITRMQSDGENGVEYANATRTEIELPFGELYRPHHSLGNAQADKSTKYELLDRVVCSTDGYTVPLGLRGAVIGIEPLANDQIILEVLFDIEFSGAIRIRGSGPQCYRMSPHALINTTYGRRKVNNPDAKSPFRSMDLAAGSASTSLKPPTYSLPRKQT